MTVETLLSFSQLGEARAAEAVHALQLLPALSEQALEEMEVAWDGMCRALLVRARFAVLDDAVRHRLEFWLARAGGRLGVDRGVLPARARVFGFVLACRGRVVEPAAREHLGALLQAALAHGAGFSPLAVLSSEGPVLSLHVGGPGWDTLSYDHRSRSLFVPTPLAPPVGDELLLRIVPSDARRGAARGEARVTETVRPGERSPGSRVGFSVTVAAPSVHAVLAATAPVPREDARAATRFRARGRARVSVPGAGQVEGTLRDVSHDGAFVVTRARIEPRARIRVALRLTGDAELVADAEVVRATRDGVGLRFGPDPELGAALAALVSGAMGRRRRVLLLQDEGPARSALAAAFRRRGYDTLATDDVVYGIQVLATELLSLDLVVVGSSVAGYEGGELVRRTREALGGAELPVVLSSGFPPAQSTRPRPGGGAGPDDGADAFAARVESMFDGGDARAEERETAAEG